MLSVRAILHPTDFSACSHHAFQLACALARNQGARLLALHVAEPRTQPMGMAPMPPLPEGHLGGYESRLELLRPLDPGILLERKVSEGDAATEILRAAEEMGCDLIAMGTHGRTGLSRMLMGSVAAKVVQNAPCPVAVVKIPLPDSSTA
jgi:nucleotide-binding universal stress UspA family protein